MMAHLDKGTYQLKIRLAHSIEVAVGKLGQVRFTPGIYIYTGRASRGLTKRLERHRKKDKPEHWHIDYLTNHPNVKIIDAEIVSDNPEDECSINQKLLGNGVTTVPVNGFGAGDCTAGCPAHLIKLRS